MGNKRKSGICTYCGKTGPFTKDHIPPKNLFSKPRPDNLITVPCCADCNNQASKDDEYFRLNVVMREESQQVDDAKSLNDVITRSMSRKKAEGFRQDWESRQKVKEIVTPSGIITGLKNTFDVDLARLDKVVKRIVLGLFYGLSNQRLPDSYEVSVFSVSGLNNVNLKTKQKLKNQIQSLLDEPYFYIGTKSVFSFWYKFTEQKSYASMWLLVFFEKTSFIATITLNGHNKRLRSAPINKYRASATAMTSNGLRQTQTARSSSWAFAGRSTNDWPVWNQIKRIQGYI